jgi:hypothetical protein
VVEPGGHKPWKLGTDAVHHGRIGIHVDARRPRIAALERQAFFDAALGELRVALRLANSE